MKKIWYLKEDKSGDKRSAKLLLYIKNGQVEGKMDLSGFSDKNTSAKEFLKLQFRNGNGGVIGEIDLTQKEVLTDSYLKGKGQLRPELAQRLQNKGEKLELSVFIGEEEYLSEGWAVGKEKRAEEAPSVSVVNREAQRIVEIEAEELLIDTKPGRRIVQLSVLEEEMLFRNFLHNSFLLHGYYNYGHVVIDETGVEPRLGVPGNFYEREQMVATMFGFPFFEPARKKDEVVSGVFGYYYTSGD